MPSAGRVEASVDGTDARNASHSTRIGDCVINGETGSVRPSELKESDFYALRSRACIQKLVSKVMTKAVKPPPKEYMPARNS